MTEIANRAEALATLRKPFPTENIAKLPKVNCSRCTEANRQQRNTTCNEHRMAKCRVCDAWITTGHIHLDYVGHAEATDRLLDADPEWTWEPMSLDANGLPKFDDGGGMWIRLTVAGVTRLGYGSADGKKGPNAIKEVIGDAIRNAGMRFGMALDLWAKTDLHADEREEQQPGAAEDEWTTPGTTPPSPLVPRADREQLEQIAAGLRAVRDLTDETEMLGAVSGIVHRAITDPAELTRAEANTVLEKLRAEDHARAKANTPQAEPTRQLADTAQITKVNIELTNRGYRNRDAKLAALSALVGRTLESSKQLFADEVAGIISRLKRGQPAPVDGNGEVAVSAYTALSKTIAEATDTDALLRVGEAMWNAHAAGQLDDTEIGKLQDQSLARENRLASAVAA